MQKADMITELLARENATREEINALRQIAWGSVDKVVCKDQAGNGTSHVAWDRQEPMSDADHLYSALTDLHFVHTSWLRRINGIKSTRSHAELNEIETKLNAFEASFRRLTKPTLH